MYVLLDMEWIEFTSESGETSRRITQLSTDRVATKWLTVSRADYLIAPLFPENTDWGNIAYNGHPKKKFIKGVSEDACVEDFVLWLEEDDVIFCWSPDTKETLCEKIAHYINDVPNCPCFCLQEKITELLCGNTPDTLSFYTTVRKSGVELEAVEHCSRSDVDLMRLMLAGLGSKATAILGSALAETDIPNKNSDSHQKRAARLKRNAHLIQRQNYQYLYTPDSQVFHCNTCHYVLDAEVLLGTPYYRRAAKHRRPCKICKPDLSYLVQPALPQNTVVQMVKSDTSNAISDRKKKPFIPRVLIGPLPTPDEPVLVTLLGLEKRTVLQDEIIGCCHYEQHPGKITVDLIKRHHCLKKRCNFFEKYEVSSLWIENERKMAQKELHKSYRAYVKKAKAERKAKEATEADALDALKTEFQRFMDALHYTVRIIRLEMQAKNVYRVFYVSDKPVLDSLYYPNFLAIVEVNHPKYQLTMQHIRDIDGHYVTIEEYEDRCSMKTCETITS